MSKDTAQLLEIKVCNNTYVPANEEALFKDEVDILDFLKSKYPALVSSYQSSINRARKEILRRLVASMLRENIKGVFSHSHDLYVIDSSIYVLNVPTVDEYWQEVIRVLNAHGLESGKVYKLSPLLEGRCLVIPTTRTYAFNRLEVEGDILYISKAKVHKIEHASELLDIMCSHENEYSNEKLSRWVRLAEELINSSANLALSYAYWVQKKKRLRKKAAKYGIKNTIDWVLFQKSQNPVFDSSLFFERLTVEGHNLHPCAKTKMGMEPEDVLRYAPEFDGITDVRFVGIRKDYVEWNFVGENDKGVNAFLFREYPDLPKVIEREFSDNGLSINDYVFVPVHSWQLEREVPHIYKQEIIERIVVPISGLSVQCGTTSSFRTVIPIASRESPKHVIKVAVNSQMTSTVRSISPNTTNNASVFTILLRSIMQREPQLFERFVPVCECGGFNFKEKETNKNEIDDNIRKLKNRNLSAVLRENVEAFIANDEVAIVGTALFTESPFSGKPILIELIERYAEDKQETSLRKAAFQFFSEYLSIALPGFIILMVKYGIGLEGHLQNSVIVFKEGRPVRMLFRDWGGVRIHRERLRQYQSDVQFYPGSITMTDNLEEVHNKVFYTVFQNQLSELILQLCKHIELDERKLWGEVHRICENVFKELEHLPLYSKNAHIDKEALYQPEVPHKALTKMRLATEVAGYLYSMVPNPLYEIARKDV